MSEKPSTSASRPMGPGGMGRGGFGMQGPSEKAKDFRRTMRTLVGYLRPHWFAIATVILFAVASTAFAIASPKILGNATNKIVDGFVDRLLYDQVTAKLPDGVSLPAGTTGADVLAHMPASVVNKIPPSELNQIKQLDLTHRPSYDYAGIERIAYLLLGLYVLSAGFSYAQGWIMTDVSQKVTYELRRGIATKIERLPLRYFDTRTHGEILSRLTNDVELVSQTLNQSLSQIVTSVMMLIGILIMMFTISWQMTIVALLVLPASMVIISLVVGRSQRYFLAQQTTLGDLNGHVEEMFSGHTVMKVFNGKERSIREFKRINTELYHSAWKSQFLSGLMMPIMSFIGNVGFVGVSVLGGWLAIRGTINIGDIQAFIQYMNQFTQPITQTANIANVLQSTAAAAERVFEFMDEPEEEPDTVAPVNLGSIKGGVAFEHVVFGYTPDKTVIKDFTATIKPGARVAIVGPTGAGKTTLVNLLMRFYDVDQGTIKIDGVETRTMKRAAVRQLFGMVLQDTWLFSGTIEDNIRYSKPDATHDEVVAAAKAAHADHFIRALPGGYKMKLNEEADNVSQGEKQLLTIARAMLADTPMLILDEATSSVDTRTEALIQKAMDKLMHGKTSFVIAHRLSTIRDADLILVMRDGNIVEQGTHKELLAANGFYASLYNSQFTAPIDEPLPVSGLA